MAKTDKSVLKGLRGLMLKIILHLTETWLEKMHPQSLVILLILTPSHKPSNSLYARVFKLLSLGTSILIRGWRRRWRP